MHTLCHDALLILIYPIKQALFMSHKTAAARLHPPATTALTRLFLFKAYPTALLGFFVRLLGHWGITAASAQTSLCLNGMLSATRELRQGRIVIVDWFDYG